jgi:hypothetical protein
MTNITVFITEPEAAAEPVRSGTIPHGTVFHGRIGGNKHRLFIAIRNYGDGKITILPLDIDTLGTPTAGICWNDVGIDEYRPVKSVEIIVRG